MLVDSTLGDFRDWSKAWSELWESIWKEAKEKGMETAKDLELKAAFFEPALKKPNVAFRLRQMVSDYSGWHFVNTDPLRSSVQPAIDRLQEIKVPTLIIVGERDLPDFHMIADILNKKIQNSERITLKGAGHVSNMETPREFNEAVSSFLATV